MKRRSVIAAWAATAAVAVGAPAAIAGPEPDPDPSAPKGRPLVWDKSTYSYTTPAVNPRTGKVIPGLRFRCYVPWRGPVRCKLIRG